MKFLVLAMCVCAASAATFGTFRPYNPVVPAAQAAAEVFIAPVTAAKTVVDAAAEVVQVAPVPAVKSYQTTDSDDAAVILRQESEITPEGNFKYGFESSNGITSGASGFLTKDKDVSFVTSQGSYSYYSPDGTPVEITYTADENGFHPKGDVLPVGPQIPAAIARSLEYIAAQPKYQIVETN